MLAIDYAQRAKGSFSLPEACLKIKELMEDDRSSIHDFANVVSVDPSLTSRLLQIANSPIYNLPGEVGTISRAISIIGVSSIYELTLVDAATSAFSHFSDVPIDLDRFWRSSVYCGLAAKNLAISAGVKDIERFFVVGLLVGFGELIVASFTPETAQCCEIMIPGTLPWEVQENELGFTYADISAQILKLWQIPEKISLPIRHFTQASAIQINRDVKVLNIASKLTFKYTHPEHFEFNKHIDEKMCNSLGIGLDDVLNAANYACEEVDNVIGVMGPKMTTSRQTAFVD